MRHHSFRAWDKKLLKMSDEFGLFDIYSGRDESSVPGLDSFEDSERFEIMQSTGLKDKNGKQIYEGDVVVVTSDNKYLPKRYQAAVEFIDKGGAFYVRSNDTNGIVMLCMLASENDSELDVIGNIFENSNLITKEEKHV